MRDRVDIMINSGCNINCIFCYHNWFTNVSWYDFSIQKIEEILIEWKVIWIKEVYISWWEPTISDELFLVIKIAKELWYKKIKIMTNWIKLSDYTYCKRLSDSGATNLAISMHWYNKEEYEFHTNIKWTYEKLIKWLINSRDFFDIDINVVVTSVNIKNLNKLVKLILTLWFKRIHLQHIVPNSSNNLNLIPGNLEIKIFINDLVKKFINDLDITLEFFPYCLIQDTKLLWWFDIKDDFITNNQLMFDNWSSWILKNKIIKKKCENCIDFQRCNWYWI